jgi:glycine oxidase
MAGAMLAPYCEAESAEPIIKELGLRSMAFWREEFPDLKAHGTLVIAMQRDAGELRRFARLTEGHRWVAGSEIASLEPALSNRFQLGLFYEGEAHFPPRLALSMLIAKLRFRGVKIDFASPVPEPLWMAASAGELVIDCRGIAARGVLANLRGVRGEMVVVHAPGLSLTRPIRLLHPRVPIYVVPWGDDTFMIGATVVETDWAGPVTVKSAIDLLAASVAIHPGLAEAHLLECSTGIRPAFKDNVPKIISRGRCLHVNGAFRHGFLLAPALAHVVADHLEGRGEIPPQLVNSS